MKQILLAIALTIAVFAPRAQAGIAYQLPFFTDLRAEVIKQMNNASNNVAEGIDVAANKKLFNSTKSALKLIDKANANPGYVTGAKAFNVLAKNLRRTTLSNEFNPILESTFGLYLDSLLNDWETLDARLASTYPGKARTAAEANLAKLFPAIEAADNAGDLLLALKSLSAAAKAHVATEKAIVKAEAAPAPPAQITARVTGSLNTTIKTLAAGIVAGDGLVVNGAQPAGIGFKQINFSVLNVPEGTSEVNVAFGNINIQSGANATNYGNGVGTATVTRNNANGTAYGTFTFTAQGVSGTSGTITVTGEFFGTF